MSESHFFPAIILVEPQMGENIGAAVRAMANFGLKDLRLIAPRDGWPNERAEAVSAGGLAHINAVNVYSTLAAAIADCQFVLATTARRRDMVKPVYTLSGAVRECHDRQAGGQKTAVLFGRERNGLENDEIAMTQGVINVPANPDFASINLAQTVLLMGYEWFQQADDRPGKFTEYGGGERASSEQLEQFLKRLDAELLEGGFFRSEGLRPTMKRNIANIFTRIDFTEQELNTLQGILSCLTGKRSTH